MDINTSKYENYLDKVPMGFNPFSIGSNLTDVFRDDVAMAIWMGYRGNHLYTQYDTKTVPKLCLDISKKLKESNLSRSRVHMWFKRQFNHGHLEMEDDQIAALVPYLVREKTATWCIKEDKVCV